LFGLIGPLAGGVEMDPSHVALRRVPEPA